MGGACSSTFKINVFQIKDQRYSQYSGIVFNIIKSGTKISYREITKHLLRIYDKQGLKSMQT